MLTNALHLPEYSDNYLHDLHRAMFLLVTSLCLAFSGADIEFVFVLMASA